MNPHLLKILFPNASAGVLAANSGDYGTGEPDLEVKGTRKPAKLEQDSGHAPLPAPRAKKETTTRFFIRVTDVRKRLLDPDNLCEKFHIDLLRYAGVIPGDSADEISLETTQRKITKGEEPHTEIEVYQIV